MKTGLSVILKKNVGPWVFALTCLLFATVVATAKLMADAVLAVPDLINW